MPGAIYRAIQADFSAGELDPMTIANPGMPQRARGLKESYNTLHLPNATVSKRPGLLREITASFGAIASHDAWTPVEVQMESGETAIVFLGATARVIIGGAFYDVPIYASPEEGETETISLSAALRHTAVYQQYIFISYPEDAATGFLVLHIEKDSVAGVRVYRPAEAADVALPDGIGACTRPLFVSNGRLILASRNVFNASMQRTEQIKETDTGFPQWMTDFTLASYTYRYVYGYSATVDGYTVTEQVVYESVDKVPPSDPFTDAANIVKRTRTIHKETGTDQWEEYIVTDSYSYGTVYITDIVKRTKDADGNVSATSAESYPDVEAYPQNPTTEKTEVPDVQATYGIQVRENDMFGSSIKWITLAGRVIVGTETAIFIGVDQYLDPRTFDLVITSYTGTSAQQPKVLNSFVVFTSSDRKKLYVGIYSDAMKGLSVTEATANVKHLFLSGIKDYFIADNPYRVIYVLTGNGECRVCIPVFTSDGGVTFAWSTWDFGEGHVEYICFDRRAEKEPRTYFIMRDASGIGWIYTLDYREPYLYGETDTDLLLDYADIQTIENTEAWIELTSPFLGAYSELQVMLTYSDGRQSVLRNAPVRISEDGKPEVWVSYKRDDLPETEDVEMKVGASYTTRIALLQQILPANSGFSLLTRHSIDKLYLQIYRSQGGEVIAAGVNVADILQLQYGRDVYNDNATNPLTGKPYTFTGTYTIDNPTQNVTDDELVIASSDPYPFNLMAVAMKYLITEVY